MAWAEGVPPFILSRRSDEDGAGVVEDGRRTSLQLLSRKGRGSWSAGVLAGWPGGVPRLRSSDVSRDELASPSTWRETRATPAGEDASAPLLRRRLHRVHQVGVLRPSSGVPRFALRRLRRLLRKQWRCAAGGGHTNTELIARVSGRVRCLHGFRRGSPNGCDEDGSTPSGPLIRCDDGYSVVD